MRQKKFIAFAPITPERGLASPSRYTEFTEADAMHTWSGKARRRRPRRRPAARNRPGAWRGGQLTLPLAIPMALGLALGVVVVESGGTTTKLGIAPAAASATATAA